MNYLYTLKAFLIMPFMTQLLHAETWTNPLVEQRADPHISLHDGQYYLIATVPEYDRIELRRADSLEGLRDAEAVDIWTRHESGRMSHHIWAPELHRIDGKWYIHVAAGEAERIWNIRMYVLENASADPFQGEWIEKGQIETEWDSFSLDATTFEHLGKRYLVWAQHDPKIGGNTCLYLSEMDTPWSLTGPQIRLTKPKLPWETIKYSVNEGPAVLKRNGRIFIAYSASATNHNYAIGLLTADEGANLLDPKAWIKSPLPVFGSWAPASQYGPGHNSFTTSKDGKTDILVYHARNYKEIEGPELNNPDRHTRAQPFGWNPDGTPDFGAPVADGPLPVPMADKPLFRDPIYDGAADPVVLWNPLRQRWWMFYTNRRANAEGLSGFAWVHGTDIGIAESDDAGASWSYAGTIVAALPEELIGDEPTLWAPEVITAPSGKHHMYLTVVPGVFESWDHPRRLVHLASDDLRHWEYESTLDLATDRVLDACVIQLPDGSWRMWYNEEHDGKAVYQADSPDLYEWTDQGRVIHDQPGEGPKVFNWRGAYWMVTDVWDGLAVYRSNNATDWQRQPSGNILREPGRGEDDGVRGGHADVVVQGERAFIFYFTHPGRETDQDTSPAGLAGRRSSIQVAELQIGEDGWIKVDRDAPVHLRLTPPATLSGK